MGLDIKLRIVQTRGQMERCHHVFGVRLLKYVEIKSVIRA